MKIQPTMLLIIGVVVLAVGGVLYVSGGPPKADAALAAKCRTAMAARGPDTDNLAARCDQQAFASMITATDADSAAQSIAAANNSEVGGSALSMFLLGLGAVLTLGGLIAVIKQKR